jgi:hypothetical protein
MPRKALSGDAALRGSYWRQLADGKVPSAGALNAILKYQDRRRKKGKCARGLGWPLLPSS